MALALAPERTILIENGAMRPMSDISGLHTIRIANATPSLKEVEDLRKRLELAGCDFSMTVDTHADDLPL